MGTSIFFIIYLITLFMQREVEQSYNIESSLLNALTGSLPMIGSGGYFNSGAGATGELGSGDDFYAWMSTVVGAIYTDPVCGDGVCDSGEFQGVGRFGCVCLSNGCHPLNPPPPPSLPPSNASIASPSLLRTRPHAMLQVHR